MKRTIKQRLRKRLLHRPIPKQQRIFACYSEWIFPDEPKDKPNDRI